jgi:uncharacterized protein YndB with AHSA1/START domain
VSNAQAAAVPALIVRRTFAAPRERVFAAWTRAELLRAWFTPPGSHVHAVTFDARAGGRYRIEMSNDGESFNVGGTITEFQPPARLAFTWRWDEDDPALEFDTCVSIDFIDRGAQTEMVLTHTGLASNESRARHEHGWNGCLDNLPAALENA